MSQSTGKKHDRVFLSSAAKDLLEKQRLVFEREIARLQEEVEEIKDERSLQILQRAHELKRENEMLKRTLGNIQVINTEESEEAVNSEEEEYLRAQYYEALRRAEMQRELESAYYHQLRQSNQIPDPNKDPRFQRGSDYQTPEQPDYFHYYVYGTEKDTASAHYRPGQSNTNLRKPPSGNKNASSNSRVTKPLKSSQKESSEKQMQQDQDSFKISPIYSDNTQKIKRKNTQHIATNGKSSNFSLSGSEERDFNYLGTSEKDSKERQGSRHEEKFQQAKNTDSEIENVLDAKSDQKPPSVQHSDHNSAKESEKAFSERPQTSEQPFRMKKISHQSDQLRPVARYPGDKPEPLSDRPQRSSEKRESFNERCERSSERKQKIQRKMVQTPEKKSAQKPREFYDPYREYKSQMLENLARKLSFAPVDNPKTPEKRTWNNVQTQKMSYFNPMKERYIDFTVKLNIYQADETDLNMSPQGKKRRALIEDFARSGQSQPGFSHSTVHDFTIKVEKGRLQDQHKERNQIKMF